MFGEDQRMRRLIQTAICVLGLSIVGFGLWYVNGRMGKSSAVPITLATIEQIDSGEISFEQRRSGEIFVHVIDRFGDGHIHVLNYEGVSTTKALEILTAKQREMEEAHWAILGGSWHLETSAVSEILNKAQAHLEFALAQSASAIDRTDLGAILSKWDSYSCQLYPEFERRSGGKLLVMKFFPSHRRGTTFKNWRTAPILVKGGGHDFWTLNYDLEKREYFGFAVNAIQ